MVGEYSNRLNNYRFNNPGTIVSFLLLSLFFYVPSSFAQIIPDNTLSPHASQVPGNVGNLTDVFISGGSRSDNSRNLFHSFTDFQVGATQRVRFENPTGVSHIFLRVTGR